MAESDPSLMVVLAGLVARLSPRLDSVRAAAHAPRRPRRHPRHRLRQYRRHQRAAHRPQGSRGRDPAPRRAQGHGCGADRPALRGDEPALVGRARRLSRPSLPGLAAVSRAARASPPISACCSAFAWPVALVFAVVWLAIAFISALLLALGPDRRRCSSPLRPVLASATGGKPALFAVLTLLRLGHAPRQYRAPRSAAPRAEIGQKTHERCAAPCRLTDRQRLDWLRLIRTDNVGPLTFRGCSTASAAPRRCSRRCPSLAPRSGKRSASPREAEADDEIEALRRAGARLVALGEPDYPALLRDDRFGAAPRRDPRPSATS